ncbi:MAG: ABC transporter permease, partial [Acidobacteria bacterium]|nr:ABC transporter permease [Acidobacteriota bacterium]
MTDKKLRSSAVVLGLAHLVVAGAAFFAPYDPAEQHREAPFAPPARLHFVRQGNFHLRPYGCAWINPSPELAPLRYVEDCTRVSPLRFFVRSRSASGKTWHFFAPDGPAPVFLLGTDDYGRDQLSRLLFGGQVSLFAGWLATALSLALGLLFGGAAGYFGGWFDDAIMRGAEVFMALPWIYLLFAVRAFLPLDVGPRETFFLIVGVIGATGWARPARLVRGVILSARERDFVRAARGFGASD